MAILFIRAEKYLFPLVQALLAWRQFGHLRTHLVAYAALKSTLPDYETLSKVYAVASIRHFLLLALVIFSGCSLLLNHAPTVLPDKLKHIVLPLTMTFYFVLYTLVDDLPFFLRRSLLPIEWQLPFGEGGVLLSALGYGLAFWGICYLRRAFGVFVSVRGIVLGGPYAYIRHPIYTGYLLDSLGLLAVNCSVAMIVLVLGLVVLMICRAKLEEEKLSESSGEYTRHLLKTGFLFPRRL